MKKFIACLLFSAVILTLGGCTSQNNTESSNSSSNASADTSSGSSAVSSSSSSDISSSQKSDADTASSSKSSTLKKEESSADKSSQNISEKVKDYILNGQNDKPEAGKLQWTADFLNKVDIDSLYKKYIQEGGDKDTVEKFAQYITDNAPIPDDWKEMFEKNLYDSYGYKVSKLEHLEGDRYQAYVIIDGKEVPYVVVSARTGYFHG